MDSNVNLNSMMTLPKEDGVWNSVFQCLRQMKIHYLFLISQVMFVIPIHVKMEVFVCQDCLTIPFPVSVQMASQIPTVLVLWRLVSARFKHFSSYPLCLHEWLTNLAWCNMGILYKIAVCCESVSSSVVLSIL